MTSRTRLSDDLRQLTSAVVDLAKDGRGLGREQVASLAGVLRRCAVDALQIEVDLVAAECAADVAAEAAGRLPARLDTADPASLPRLLETVCRTLQGAARRCEPLDPHHAAGLALLVRRGIDVAGALTDAARERDELRAIAADLDLSTARPRPRAVPPADAGANVVRFPVIGRPIHPPVPPPAPGPGDAA